MADELALSPEEAAYIASNVYFTLAGWEATYKFKQMFGDRDGAPKPSAGMATKDVINRNVTGSGPVSVAKAGINDAKVVKSFSGSSGSNLIGRVKTGFGYVLQFTRQNKNHLVIATRGTRPELGAPDLITDANAGFTRIMPGIGPVHAGFYDVYDSLLPSLTAAEAMAKSADVVHCVGHSLGGAVANLVAIHFARRGAKVRLYTFGAPRVGISPAGYHKKLNALLGEENIYRVSHNFDPVPMVPMIPYIHVLPNQKDDNNFFIGSPSTTISMNNHDMGGYINSVNGKDWKRLRAVKTNEFFLDKQYFTCWRSSQNWLKQYAGYGGNYIMSVLQRILRGLLQAVSVGVEAVATILDLLAYIKNKSIQFVNTASNYITKFIRECIQMFNLGVEITTQAISKLYNVIKDELAIALKMAVKMAAKAATSKEFLILLAAASTSSIGFICL